MESRTAPRKTRIKYLHRARFLGPGVFVCVVIIVSHGLLLLAMILWTKVLLGGYDACFILILSAFFFIVW